MAERGDRRGRWAVLGGAVVLASGCALGPNYKRPSLPVSPDYKELQGETAGQWKRAQPSDVSARGKWWEVFGDPDLNALEEQVGVSNQNIAQAEAQFRGARAVARGARADLFPTVTAGASVARSRASRSRTSTSSAAPAGTTINSYQVSGDASYEVDAWGRIRRSLEASVENARASAADLETVRLSIHAELAADYYLLRGVDAQRQLLASNVDGYEKALQLTVNRHNQGIVSGVDVAQAETQLETTRAQWTDLGITRAQLEHAIAILVGKPPADFAIAPAGASVGPPEIPVSLPSELLERRPDVAAAERHVASANAQIGVAEAGFFPTLLLSATGGWGASTLTKFFSAPNLFWSVGAALAQTIFEGGKRVAAKEQAVAAYDATVAAYRLSVLTAFQDVEDSLAAVRILGEETAQQERAVAAAERSLTLAKNRYEGGITTYLEVVTAQAVALADERAAVELQTRRMTESVNLIKALGGGWSAGDLPSAGAVLSHAPTAAEQPR